MPISVITSKGRITIPKSVREYLGVKAHDKLLYTPEHGRVIITPIKGSIRSLRGIFKLPAWEKRPLNFKKLRRAFERGMAENVLKEMR